MAKSTTFQGAAKPFGKSGHFVEPRRHALQAKGIKTGHLAQQPLLPAPKGRLVVKEYRVYKFDELSPKAKEKALEDQRTFEGEVWTADDYLVPNFKEDMGKLGFSKVDVSYSGFWSQGDGASFTALVDLPKYIKATKQEKKYAKLLKGMEEGDIDDSALIERTNHQDSHENTVRAGDVHYHGSDEETQKQADALSEDLTQFVREESKKLYDKMESDYEDATSDEALKESIEMNEYEFTEDGKIH